MEASFWHARWQSQQIGFHQATVNENLARWWPTLGVPSDARVLVPLCGKSVDLLWLRQQGHSVVGVELAESACRGFFEENALPFRVEQAGAYVRWLGEGAADGIIVLQGDFFAAPADVIGPVSALYDRAALIALPPPMRELHCAQLAALLPTGARGLLVTIAYPQSEKAGPPFSVPTSEVHERLDADFSVESVHEADQLATPDAPNRWGLTALSELVHALTRTA